MISFLITFGALVFVVFCAVAWLEIYRDDAKTQRRLVAINQGGNR